MKYFKHILAAILPQLIAMIRKQFINNVISPENQDVPNHISRKIRRFDIQ